MSESRNNKRIEENGLIRSSIAEAIEHKKEKKKKATFKGGGSPIVAMQRLWSFIKKKKKYNDYRQCV